MDIRGGNINGASIQGNPALYTFTTWTFTNANSTGVSGPTTANLRAIYDTTGNTWINSDEYFTSPAGIQTWTVPVTGTYSVTAAGSSGGGNVGRGALISGTTTLYRGETVRIVVGQRGANTSAAYGSGGGGSFVVRSPFNSNASIIAIAGGGGGISYRSGVGVGNLTYAQGSATVAPGTNIQSAATGGGGGGATFSGGLNGANGSTSSSGWGGGGGGFRGNGGTQAGTGVGGSSFTNGSSGGTGLGANGGFGGGGGASTASGGGAGGYNGGNNGSDSNPAAGGGSYTLNLSGVSATANAVLGNGYVTVTLVSVA